jgi:hypothetical protein
MSAGSAAAHGDDAGGAASPFVYDLGLQSERTTLAWQRAGLSVTVGSLVLLRGGTTSLAADLGGAFGIHGLPFPLAVCAVVVGVLGLVAAALIAVRSRGRHPRLLRPGRGAVPGQAPGAGPVPVPVPGLTPEPVPVPLPPPMPGAALLALLCSVALVFGAVALAFVLASAGG